MQTKKASTVKKLATQAKRKQYRFSNRIQSVRCAVEYA